MNRRESLDATLLAAIRRSNIWLGVWAGLYVLANGVSSGLLALAGMLVFYRAMARYTGRSKWLRIVAAFALFAGSQTMKTLEDLGRLAAYAWIVDQVASVDRRFRTAASTSVSGFVTLGSFVFPVLACNAFARANRFRREHLLLQAASGGLSPDEYLARIRAELDYRYEDVGFHLKYAEALAARGDDRAVAIEARLLLVQDPYNFTGNLLLAQSYLRLGLPAECERVCDEYLQVAGYCFEFVELRDSSRKQLEGQP
jgi:hypothetical protein